MKRRTFVKGSAITAGLVALGPKASAAPVTRINRRVVIIGSGFGGAVSALRLTRAGVPVTLLEQGRAWPTGPNANTFPTLRTLDERVLFYDSAPVLFNQPFLGPLAYAGLLRAVVAPTMTVVSGCGYGGGSLTYQGMTLEPARNVFEEEFPAALDYDEMHTEHYPVVRQMLGAQVAPDALVNSPTYLTPRIWKKRAEALGFPVSKIPMPIDWTWALRELNGEMKPSYTNGDCALGVNNGGKNSLDVTYLRQAEQTGNLEVRLLHRVTDISRTATGQWQVVVSRTDVHARLQETVVITTPTLVMGAGTMGTSNLLVRAAATGQITDLPDGLGTGWGSNADRIYAWSPFTEKLASPQGGPVVFGNLDWGDAATANTVIQASIPPVLLGGPGFPVNATIMVGYGVSKARGHFVYNPLLDKAVLKWEHEADRAIQAKIGPKVKAIAGPSVLVDTNLALPWTWHPMGGASMGSVCDFEGRVQGQRGLYVMDGALLPGTAAACNPSMTIAAVAERAMKRIVASDVGTII
ncbi:GMC oxidoreductase [Nocardioides marmorisolisilvae]|uniref:Cholesterol oxidase n=1 Tax=Nocardioides marmorisolisilvae TaxID=1542737 RepID=A0A3N0DRS7_9ACTN|nr:GMC oxidoreductase [Nocardioides marmorisolisilvae]RNL78330.1 GMC family oxidoreductase [Nocardioides marmorisolisilvae]